MAIAGNRSPSPTTTNSRPKLISRNSELNSSPMRKSSGPNPFQRLLRNGPPDSSSRNYLTKEEKENDTDQHILKQAKTRSPSVPKATNHYNADSSSRNYLTKEEKENDTDHHILKQAKTRSPSAPKAMNHFMIPTISAASKINPSPRKKVLGDRNEPSRTSLSFSEDKSHFSLLDCDKKPAKDAAETPFNPNVSPISNIVPLDANPSLPPYDPKTNFLSPRPQFLHYRPKPRLEHYYQEQVNGIKNLEDSFLYESSSSDKEVSEGSAVDSSRRESDDSFSAEGIIEHSQKETDEVSSIEADHNRSGQPITTPIKDNEFNDKSELIDSQNEVEDVSFDEVVNENFRIEIEDSSSVDVNSKADVEVLDIEPISTLISELSEGSELENFKKEFEDVSLVDVRTGNITRKSMVTSLVDIVSRDDGCKFSEPEPIMNRSILKETTGKEKREVKSLLFSRGKFIPLLLFLLFACFFVSSIDSPISDVKFLRSSKFYEKRFNGFAREIKIWSDYSTSYVNELISSFTKVEKSGPMLFLNLTYKQDDPFIGMKRVEEISVQDEVENVFEDEDELERLLDENLEDGNQNIKNEHDFDIVCDLPNGIDFEEKLWASLELSPKEPVSEAIEEDYASKLISAEEEFSTAIPSNYASKLISAEDEFSTAIPSIKSTLEFNLEEVASDVIKEYHVGNSEISEIMRTERGHCVSDYAIVSIFENTLEEGGSQVDPEYNYEKTENVEIKDNSQFVSGSEIKPTKVESFIENTLQMNDSTSDLMPDYKSSNQYKTLAISLLVLALIAAPILIYLKNKNRNIHNSTVLLDPVSKNKKIKSDTGPQSYSPELEMSSSFDGSYSYSKGYTWGITNEAHSKERKQKRVSKREFLASSSGFSVSDSPSYGSFTTYERLSKQGFGDDEVVTPVRRSSRIKKIQVASP